MGCSKKEKDEDDIKNVVIGISTCLPNIWDQEQPIVKLDKGNLASENLVNNVLDAERKVKNYCKNLSHGLLMKTPS